MHASFMWKLSLELFKTQTTARGAERKMVTTLSTNSTLSDLDKAKKQVTEMIKSMDPELMCTIWKKPQAASFNSPFPTTQELCAYRFPRMICSISSKMQAQ